MSRVGKLPISIPKEVETKIMGDTIIFKKGKIEEVLNTEGRVKIEFADNALGFKPLEGSPNARAFWGTYRALANNIVMGLTQGFSRQLEINGVGYRAAVKGRVLELQLGFSHPINYPIPEGIEISVEKNVVVIKGHNKQQVGQVSAEIRGYRPPEPYKGKGVKYSDEHILRKAGKTSKK